MTDPGPSLGQMLAFLRQGAASLGSGTAEAAPSANRPDNAQWGSLGATAPPVVGAGPSSDQLGQMLALLRQAAATPNPSPANAAPVAGPGNRPNAAPGLPAAQQAQNVANARAAMSNPEVFAFMQALSTGEGDYDQLNGGARFTGWDYPAAANRAAGAYQIVPRTYDGLRGQLGLTDFSPDTQDVMAAHLIGSAGGVAPLVNGNLQEAIGRLKGIWPSLPGGTQQNAVMSDFQARYNANLNRLMGQ
jgi:muramidase (phage lysozyme)